MKGSLAWLIGFGALVHCSTSSSGGAALDGSVDAQGDSGSVQDGRVEAQGDSGDGGMRCPADSPVALCAQVKCATEWNACVGNPDCDALRCCTASCSDATGACDTVCRQQYAGAVSAWNSLLMCVGGNCP